MDLIWILAELCKKFLYTLIPFYYILHTVSYSVAYKLAVVVNGESELLHIKFFPHSLFFNMLYFIVNVWNKCVD